VELDSGARLVVQLARRGDTPDRTDRDRVREALRETLARDANPLAGAGGERTRWEPPPALARRRAYIATWAGVGVLAISVAAVASVATVVVQRWNGGAPFDEAPAGLRAPVTDASDASSLRGVPSGNEKKSADRSLERTRVAREAARDTNASTPIVAPAPRASAPGGASRVVAQLPHHDASASLRLTLAEEAALLRRARDALAAGQLGVAEGALAEHRARALSGALAEDREALWTIVKCRRSGTGQGASGFARRFPGSALEERVESECGVAGS